MGLGRLEVLLEALDRDLDLTNTTLTAPTVSSAVHLSLATESVEGGANAGAGTALSLVKPVSLVTTATNKGHVKLANGTVAGQIKYIIHVVRNNTVNMVLTPANLRAGSEITTNLPNTPIALIWTGSTWDLLSGEYTGTAEAAIT
tara:strand:- start:141 stop:575 length:435 start_codon:yes stop_codon:yes gene_type:complete